MTGTRACCGWAWRRRPCSPPGRCAQQQQGFISRKLNAPVPGGVAVLALGDGPAAPEVTFLERRALVVREEGRQWIAVVGIPLSVKAGEQRVSIDDAKGARELARCGPRNTPRSITLKNPRQVNPSDEDMKRIEREMAEQSAANRSYRAGVTPSNLILDRPVPGGRLSSLRPAAHLQRRRAIRIPGWISPCLPARRSRRRPLAW